jgi:RNA polymerase sigma-70 factor, ECF subfamily
VQDDDAELIAGLKAGDESAFERLVRAYSGRLLAVAQRYMGGTEDARDAVQEAFISVFRSIASFEGDALLSTWLHRITINACLMKLRSRRRKPEESIEELLPAWQDDGHHLVPPAEWRETSHQLLEREQTRAIVRQCIDELPDGYRTVLLLRDIEELDTRETARMMGLSENGAKVRLHRARQALRTMLAARLGGDAR